ncbi:MAG: ROK family protein [Halarsenatibacteraceae bacterium]
MSNYFVGVDLGGTKILTAVADQKGNILADVKVATEVEKGEEYIINDIGKSIRSVVADAELNLKEIKRVGVGSPGPLSIKKGIVYETSNLPFENFPIVEMLKSKINIPVILENDANAAALGEKLFGSGIDSKVMVYITISTGIGGGLIFGEKVFHGSNDGAGEVGHMIIEPSGPSCGLGQHEGCLEAMASGTAIIRNIKTELRNNPDKWLKKYDGKIEDINGHDIARAAREGDELAKEVYQEAGKYLGIGVANLINLFNPDTIVFGGGVMNAKELFWNEMVKSVEKNALSASANDCEFLEAVLGDNTGVVGAIAVAIKG